jgi:hypothetical protein
VRPGHHATFPEPRQEKYESYAQDRYFSLEKTSRVSGAMNIMHELFGLNPYEHFDPSAYPLTLQGWHSDSPIFEEMIDQTQPDIIIEVGSWLGASAIHMGRHLKKRGWSGSIICVDTWLGSMDHWSNPEIRPLLRLQHGYPQLYYQFLANVIHAGLQDTIIPFPNTSTMACFWLKKRNIRAKLIYIDGSHEYLDILADLQNYSQLRAEGGYMFGDDWGIFPSVKRGVKKFCRQNACNYQAPRHDCFWLIPPEPLPGEVAGQ